MFSKMALPIQPLIGLPASLLAKDHKQWPSNAEQQCFHAFFPGRIQLELFK